MEVVSLLRSRHKTLNTQILLWTVYLLFLMCEFLPVILFFIATFLIIQLWYVILILGEVFVPPSPHQHSFPPLCSLTRLRLSHSLWTVMDRMFVSPQNSYTAILTPNMIVLGGGALQRWLNGKGRAFENGTSTRRRDTRVLYQPSHHEPGSQGAPRWTPHLPALWTWTSQALGLWEANIYSSVHWTMLPVS